MGHFVRVTATTDVELGHGIVAEVKGTTLAVFNIDGTFHAIDNTCVHRGGPLGEGELEGSVVTCPWHGWQYKCVDGRMRGEPFSEGCSVPSTGGRYRREGADLTEC